MKLRSVVLLCLGCLMSVSNIHAAGETNRKAYLANGLFSESDQMYNDFLAKKLRSKFPWMDLYVPQENAALNDKTGYADSVTIFQGDNSYLDESDMLIVVLDGLDTDSGVASELGRFAALCELDKSKKRTVFGLYTDIRQQGRSNQQKIDALIADGSENQFSYRNLYVIGAVKSCGFLLPNSDDLINKIEEVYA